ncbi:hypothetical protein [Flavobacterium sp.]|uniref:hypothetical protein n=1 Tax=Flavobacterium sp. TaxID=239 RepID=UPI002FDDDEDC
MKRVYKEGLITTLLGVFIIVFAGLMIYQGKSTVSEMSGWLATGLLFLRSKDSLIGIPKNDE